MPITPEDRARQNIDKLLADAGWLVQEKRQTNLAAGRGVAVRRNWTVSQNVRSLILSATNSCPSPGVYSAGAPQSIPTFLGFDSYACTLLSAP